jgi:hypothetical protein
MIKLPKNQNLDLFLLLNDLSNYGVLVGRVLANDGFGVPNAKVSIFIENNDIDETNKEDIIYQYSSYCSSSFSHSVKEDGLFQQQIKY